VFRINKNTYLCSVDNLITKKLEIMETKMNNKEIKAEALRILNTNSSSVKLSDFTVKQAKRVISEHNLITKNKTR
jgi:hypothetical protein